MIFITNFGISFGYLPFGMKVDLIPGVRNFPPHHGFWLQFHLLCPSDIPVGSLAFSTLYAALSATPLDEAVVGKRAGSV